MSDVHTADYNAIDLTFGVNVQDSTANRELVKELRAAPTIYSFSDQWKNIVIKTPFGQPCNVSCDIDRSCHQ